MPAATDRVTEKPLLLAIAYNEVLKRSFLPFCQQPEFPGERVGYEAVEVVPLRHSGKQFANARGLRHDRHRMTGAARSYADRSSAPAVRRTALTTSNTE